ncbi:DNA independent RNA polymerase I transcription factor, partial [Cryomyces antarcticus]
MGNVRLLTKRCSSLVNAVLDCSWLGRDEAFLGHYLRFLGSLASAHGGYVEEVLKRLVAYFTDLPASTGHLPNQPVVRRSQLLARVHTTLKYLLRLIPSASARLSNVLPSKFPFPTDTTKAHISYVENLLKLIQYVPELKSEVLALITERLVKIDVQIQVDMDDLEEEMGDKIVQDMQQKTIRNLEDSEASDDSDNESVSSSEDSSTPEEMRMKELRSAVATMDAILDLLFGYYSPIFANGTAWDIDETFEHLLLQFANIVLPTYRSRHTQFLLFHFGQLSPDLIAKFAGACGHLALTKERIPQLVRLSAATYLASFVARGARISSQVVRDVFDLLGSHLDYIRRTEEPTCRGPEL